MWTTMTTSIYVDLSCCSTIAVELTDLRQPLGFPARFQNKSNRSPKKRKEEFHEADFTCNSETL